ncbi:MAG TPA: universal stress protein [Gaiellaceae bacterium]|nr:universal stress protein [Gaiellaceae bacterium]
MSDANESIFDRVVVGVDGSEAGFEACRQAARLATETTAIDAVLVRPPSAPEPARAPGAGAGWDPDDALARALQILGGHARAHRLDGFAAPALLAELRRFEATLVVLGTHGHGRLAEIVFGGVAGEILHQAPSSVLVARRCLDERFPHRIVVGHDGSAPSDAALAVADALARRFQSSISVITALAGQVADPTHLPGHDRHIVAQHPVVALVEAARDADLLVVGSRGLHGVKALGSVSERVAHDAVCSVLVVRGRP